LRIDALLLLVAAIEARARREGAALSSADDELVRAIADEQPLLEQLPTFTASQSGASTSTTTTLTMSSRELLATPRSASMPVRVRAVACGDAHAIAVSERGSLLSWGMSA
jgi:hypothetical protein